MTICKVEKYLNVSQNIFNKMSKNLKGKKWISFLNSELNRKRWNSVSRELDFIIVPIGSGVLSFRLWLIPYSLLRTPALLN